MAKVTGSSPVEPTVRGIRPELADQGRNQLTVSCTSERSLWRRVTYRRWRKDRFPDRGVSRNGQAVTITFADFEVDVVPGFYRKGGGYLIPDSVLNRWIETDPKQHVEI